MFVGFLRQRPGLRGSSMGPERINKIVKVLKRAVRSAVDSGILSRSPLRKSMPLRTPKPEMRPFTPDEFDKFLIALPVRWRPYFEFAVWTGLRPGEQAALQWIDVNLNGSPPVIFVRATLDPRNSGVLRPPKTAESADSVRLYSSGCGSA